MPYPGYPGVDIELWINCRCTVRPVLAEEVLVAAFKDYTPEQRKKAHTLPDGSYPIEDCADLKNAIQAIGRAKDPAKAKAHIRTQKSRLGCPDVELPDTWSAGWCAPSEEEALTAADGERTATVIVALPDPDDQVHNIGDEDKHLTIAYLGNPLDGDIDAIKAAVATLAAQTEPLVVMVSGQGELGAEGAQVWLCEDPALNVIRQWLADEPEVGGVMQAAETHPHFVPHVTSGYGEAPDGMADINEIAFDRLAVWHAGQQFEYPLGGEMPENDTSEVETDDKPREGKFTELLNEAAKNGVHEGQRDVFAAAPPVTPGYGVLTVEGTWSGDKRRFTEGAVRTRPLPLPLNWQRMSDEGHKKSVTVFKIARTERVGNEIRYSGNFIANPESDEVQALIAEFGRFGVSIDADDVDMEFNEATDAEQEGLTFTNARSCGGSIVQIPAFHEAYIALGVEPDDFFDGGTPLESEGESMVASIEMADLAPGKTEDGPGWLTNYEDTDRLRDWWASAESGVNWGVPGDFNRCRVKAAEYVKPQYLSGFCANRHYDALGFWPGQEASVADVLESTDPAPALSLVASTYGNLKAPHEWFAMEEITDNPKGCPLTITEDGQVYGHVAAWKACHGNTQAYGECRVAPRSASNYSQFLLGETLTTEGTVATGCLTIGGGHANGRLRLREAARHYDDATSAFADVTCIDGEVGIWVCGWVRPGTPEEMVVAARASKLSGDWRKAGSNWEMIAALAVNAPGYQIPRVAAGIVDGEQISLVAANVVVHDTIPVPEHFDTELLADQIVARIEARQKAKVDMAALRARFEQKVSV
jgi:2'-5' RNA ligase